MKTRRLLRATADLPSRGYQIAKISITNHPPQLLIGLRGDHCLPTFRSGYFQMLNRVLLEISLLNSPSTAALDGADLSIPHQLVIAAERFFAIRIEIELPSIGLDVSETTGLFEKSFGK